ncbi:FecR family protein [Pseudopedobacter beijingensis]|uniref:FecR family protein n=1 Tax=Pseudopedobacter beijingensis TaxID=1207056 RepID=A0ABW4I667_9SPHI
MKKTNYLVSLLRKYIYKQLSDSESKELTDWANTNTEYKEYLNNLNQNIKTDYEDYERFYNEDKTISKRMLTSIKYKTGIKSGYFRLRYFLAAASAIIILSLGIYLGLNFKNHNNHTNNEKVAVSGGDNVILRLSDGSLINLGESSSGITTKDGEVSYIGSKQSLLQLDKAQSLEIIVPARSQYQVVLSDGTKVWLNAGSSFKYPGLFNGDIRKVELLGEAYFEVAKDRNKPFIVVSDGQEVKVTGTSFNVLAYPGENETKTTLVEGEVYVYTSANSKGKNNNQQQIRLSPGEEAVYSQGGFKKHVADIVLWQPPGKREISILKTPLLMI